MLFHLRGGAKPRLAEILLRKTLDAAKAASLGKPSPLLCSL
jgi:hypothetical protein